MQRERGSCVQVVPHHLSFRSYPVSSSSCSRLEKECSCRGNKETSLFSLQLENNFITPPSGQGTRRATVVYVQECSKQHLPPHFPLEQKGRRRDGGVMHSWQNLTRRLFQKVNKKSETVVSVRRGTVGTGDNNLISRSGEKKGMCLRSTAGSAFRQVSPFCSEERKI